jgi:hypothetical protein
MGMSEHLYVGPYLHIATKEVSVEAKVLGCPTHGLHFSPSHSRAYCSICGRKLEPYLTESIYDRMLDYFGDEWEDTMYQIPRECTTHPEYELFIPNSTESPFSVRDVNSNTEISMCAQDIVSGCDYFKKEFEKELAFLASIGYSYIVKYGVIRYWY